MIEFDLGGLRELDEMWVWAYNRTPVYARTGTLKDIHVEHKRDSEDEWTRVANPVGADERSRVFRIHNWYVSEGKQPELAKGSGVFERESGKEGS